MLCLVHDINVSVNKMSTDNSYTIKWTTNYRFQPCNLLTNCKYIIFVQEDGNTLETASCHGLEEAVSPPWDQTVAMLFH